MREVVDKNDAEIHIFPEMFLTSYCIKDDFHRLSETIEGESAKKVLKIAEDNSTCIIYGFPEKDANSRGRFYNTAMICLPNGKVEKYRKWHLANFGPFDEMRYFYKGNTLPVIEYKNMKFGVEICYDIFFPELTRYYALMGCDLVAVISASPSTTKRFFETVLPARAVENAIFMAYSNLFGHDEGFYFWGGSRIYGPRGEVKCEYKNYEEFTSVCELDFSELDSTRYFRPTLRDIRMDLYKIIENSSKIRF